MLPRENTGEILDLWAAGLSSSSIAERLGVTRNVVIGVVYRARIDRDKRAHERRSRTNRPDAHKSDLVVAAHNAGRRHREIAEHLGISVTKVEELLRHARGENSRFVVWRPGRTSHA